MAIKTGVASPRIRDTTPRGGLSLEELRRVGDRSSDLYSNVEVPAIDPRTNVQAMVGEAPQVEIPPLNQRVSGRDLLRDPSNTIESPEDVAYAYGTPFGVAPRAQPILDEQGRVVADQYGNPLSQEIGTEAYQQQLEAERSQMNETGQALEEFASNPWQAARNTIKDVLTNKRESLVGANVRQAQKQLADEEIDRVASKAATDLEFANTYGNNALFSNDSKVAARFTDINGETDWIAPGLKVLAEEGIDLGEAPKVGTIFGIALAKSVSQVGIKRKDDTEVNKPMVFTENGGILESAQYYLDYINSIKHFAKSGLENAGIKVSPEGISQMAKAMVLEGISNGDLIAIEDPRTGRQIIVADPDLKSRASSLENFSEALLGDIGRPRSLSTPARGGTSISKGRPRTTNRSVAPDEGPGIVTRAAELTKEYMGSVGLVFRPKDIIAMDRFLQDVFSEENVQRDSQGRFMYSRSVFAKALGFSKAHYDAAALKTKPPKDYNPNDPAQKKAFDKKSQEQAIDVMNAKSQKAVFDLANAKQSQGIRYSEWMHSFANQRFFPASFDVDYMGSKNVIREMLGLAAQDSIRSIDLFDPVEINRLQSLGRSVFSKRGRDRHDALNKLSHADRGAIGTMINAVVNYYSAVDGTKPNIDKYSENEILQMYTPEIGNRLADVGRKYNQWLEGQQVDSDIISLLSGIESGEGMGSRALWDDMFNLQNAYKNPQTRRNHVPMTHHTFDDGNQNGIFLQSLFFGQGAVAQRLGTYNPNQEDLRTFGFMSMLHHVKESNKDNPGKQDAWAIFFKEITDKFGTDSVAKEFFKKPLMQHAYGKDASMFGDLIADILADNEEFLPYVEKHLVNGTAYNSPFEASVDLSNAVEASLREIVDSKNTRIMNAIGRMTAVLNTPLIYPGITGDTNVLTPPSVKPVNKRVSSEQAVSMKLPDGRAVLLKGKEYETDTFRDADGNLIEVPDTRLMLDPNYAKPTSYFYDRAEQKWTEFHNALGSAQARSAVVMPIQSLDGDLVKWTTIFVNQGRNMPRAALWIHDSIISTPGDALIMRNAYNNVAIPEAVPYIARMGKMFQGIVKEAKRREVEKVLARGRPVGIGAEGDYPSMGALFQEIHDKVNSEEYKRNFLKRNSGDIRAYDKYMDSLKATLDSARSNGWVPTQELPTQAARNLAVTPAQFKELVDVAFKHLRLADDLDPWAEAFAGRVNKAAKELLLKAKHTGGVAQMTQGATGKRGKSSPDNVPVRKPPKEIPTLVDKVVPPFNYSPDTPF